MGWARAAGRDFRDWVFWVPGGGTCLAFGVHVSDGWQRGIRANAVVRNLSWLIDAQNALVVRGYFVFGDSSFAVRSRLAGVLFLGHPL